LRNLGLTPKDIKAKISSRRLLAEFLIAVGIPQDQLESLYPILDKKPKLPPEAFDEMLAKAVPQTEIAERIQKFMVCSDIDNIYSILEDHSENRENMGKLLHSIGELKGLFGYLESMGITDYCVFDPGIVRGLAYYTGVVFEVHDAVGDLRAICGGGRYDNLLGDFGGPQVTGTGMGMGDCVLEILLREKGLLKDDIPTRKLDYFVACVKDDLRDVAIETVAKLRKAGLAADLSYKSNALKKQLKQATALGAGKCVIVGDEYSDQKKLVIKDMDSGEQELVDADGFDGK